VKFSASIVRLALISFVVAATCGAADATTDAENPEEFTRVRGLFDVDLPKTVEKFKAKVTLHPHFGDLLHRDYLRLPVGVRMGVSDNTEVSSEVEAYVTHGLKQSAGYGFDLVRLGAKHQLRKSAHSDIDISLGLNTAFPVGRPPLSLTDGFNHFSPYVTISKPWMGHPQLTPFLSVGTDLIWRSSVPGEFTKNQPHSDSMGVSTGFLYDRRQIKYALTTSYWTTSLIGQGNRQFFSVNPSVLVQLPPALKFHAQGNWIVGVGFKTNFGPDGTDLGLSLKLRGEFNFSHFLRRTRDAWIKSETPRAPERLR
jgi:hypothetical protein